MSWRHASLVSPLPHILLLLNCCAQTRTYTHVRTVRTLIDEVRWLTLVHDNRFLAVINKKHTMVTLYQRMQRLSFQI